MPLGLNINAKGALYLEKEGRHNLIKNQIHITLSFVVPLLLKLVPEHVLQNILHSVSTIFFLSHPFIFYGKYWFDYTFIILN